MRKESKEELKALCYEPKSNDTPIYDLSDLKVSVLDYMKNPYKPMFEMALQTWSTPGKWKKASPELRFDVVKGVLERKALPLGMEVPKFAFQIENISRAAFDQIARTRAGVVYAARGFKDNDLNTLGFVVPTRLTEEQKETVVSFAKQSKEVYKSLQNESVPNWAARCVIPMYSAYNFIMIINYDALQRFCANRMQTTEMEDTVATAWLFRERVKELFPLLAEYLRPACDWKRKDTTGEVNGFADVLGIPHVSDNRQPGFDSSTYPIIRNAEACTDMSKIEKILNINTPKAGKSNDWIDYKWDTLTEVDTLLFKDK